MQNKTHVNQPLFNLNDYTIKPEIDAVEIYHDESKDKHEIHGFLIVPTRIKATLLEELASIRSKHNCDSKLHYTDLTGKKETCKTKAAKECILLLTQAMQGKKHNRTIWGDLAPALKFVLFKKLNKKKLDSAFFSNNTSDKKEIDLRKIETLMRIGIKGGLHYLYGTEDKIQIQGFYTDGVPFHRTYDQDRIITRLTYESRNYIDINPSLIINPIFSDHKDPRCLDSERAEILQMTDLMIGAFKQCIFKGDPESHKYKIAEPVRNILRKKIKRKGNFKHSRHYKSFSLTKATLNPNAKSVYDSWIYEEPELVDSAPNNSSQLQLF